MKAYSCCYALTLFLYLSGSSVSAQTEVTPLFQNEDPVEIKFQCSLRDVKRNKIDSVFVQTNLHYKSAQDLWDSIPVDLQARGHFRRENCSLPPIRVRIKKHDSEHTLFAGNKKLKLVIPCERGEQYDKLILREYICYQLYENVTPYHFNTRLTRITLIDEGKKKKSTHQLTGYFIEDDDLVADRFNGKIKEDMTIHPLNLQDTLSVLHDFFQYMISNTDWSAVASHNVKVLQLKTNQYIPMAYDFDMSGVVNAPYAQVSELIPASTVRERVYRGFCRSPQLFQYVRKEYLKLEQELMKVPERKELPSKDVTDIKNYLSEFFTILKSDKAFTDNIVLKCRTN